MISRENRRIMSRSVRLLWKLAQEEAKRVREVTEARRKSKAMAGALQVIKMRVVR